VRDRHIVAAAVKDAEIGVIAKDVGDSGLFDITEIDCGRRGEIQREAVFARRKARRAKHISEPGVVAAGVDDGGGSGSWNPEQGQHGAQRGGNRTHGSYLPVSCPFPPWRSVTRTAVLSIAK
jgi:hypothetical protein